MTGFVLAAGLFFGFGFGEKQKTRSCRVGNCEVTRTVTIKKEKLSDEEATKEEARQMSLLKRMHVFRTPRGCFEGCGISRNPEPPTCKPCRKMRLVADSIVERDGWFYRCRLWRPLAK